MARAKVKTSGSTRSVAADSAAVAALAGTLESLLAQSQASADRLTRLLAQAHGVQAGPAAAEVVPPRDDSRTDQLETARAVAEAADQAKSCFLAALSRELRTPVDGLARRLALPQHHDHPHQQPPPPRPRNRQRTHPDLA